MLGRHDSSIKFLILNLLASIIWIYSVTTLFVYNIDGALIEFLGLNSTSYLIYKLPVILVSIIFISIVFSKKIIAKWLTFILLYPFILIFWIIPKFLFEGRRYSLGFFLVNAIITFLKNIRFNALILSGYAVGYLLAFEIESKVLLWCSILLLSILLLISYGRQIVFMFKPSSFIYNYKDFLKSVSDSLTEQFKPDNDLTGIAISNFNSTQLTAWSTRLGTNVIFSRFLLFSARRLKDYQESGFRAMSNLFVTFKLILLTTLTFSAINIALYKIDMSAFSTTGNLNIFTFMYYSFRTLVFSSILEITPIKLASEFVSVCENFSAIFITVTFMSLIIPAREQRYTRELQDIVSTFEEENRRTESAIKKNFNISDMEQAIDELKKANYAMIRLILYLSA